MPRPPPVTDDSGGGAGAQSHCRMAPTLMRHNDGGATVHLLMGQRMNTNGFINLIARSGALAQQSAAGVFR